MTPRAELFSSANRSTPEANKWELSEFVLNALIPIVGIHPFPLDELLLMCSAVSYFHPELIIEWGTHRGYSARVFFEIVHHLQMPTQIHSIDLPASVQHVENTLPLTERGRLVKEVGVNLHLGDGLSIACEIVNAQPSAAPLFFLDGDHSFSAVMRELEGLVQLAPQAAVLVHDSFWQGEEARYNCGPSEAIALFTETHHLPRRDTLLGLPGMSLIHWSASR